MHIENNSQQLSICGQLRAACGQQLHAAPDQVFSGVVANLRAVRAVFKKNTVFTDINPTSVFSIRANAKIARRARKSAQSLVSLRLDLRAEGARRLHVAARTTISAQINRVSPPLHSDSHSP